ncbi:DNA polymerase III subunit beta [Azospirillum sp. B2RO_4]|uniref:DNA polymerase III subunit beta n=1 Tax=Azospirillum sp. B2RO_4 TaxID=3027796 RepID=UPI003DA7FE93
MPIPNSCIRDVPLYAALIGKGGLTNPASITIRQGTAKKEVCVRPQDLPHGAFARLVRDEIDPLWGARDLAPDEFDDLVDLINDRDSVGVLRPLHIFDPEDMNVRKIRVIYSQMDKGENQASPSVALVLDAAWVELSGNGTFFEDMKAEEEAEAEEAEAEDTESAPAPAEATPADTPPPAAPAPANVVPFRPAEPPATPAQPIRAPKSAANPQPKGTTPMQFTVDKGPLLAALKRAVAMVGKKTTMPILECVLLDISETTLTISATDLAVDVQVKLPIGIGARPGRLAIPGSALATAIDAMPDGAQLTLEVVDAKAEGARLRILCGKTRFHLPTYQAEDFPTFAQVDGAELFVQVSALKQAIDRVAWAMCSDETKPNLMGMFIHARPEGLRVVTATGQVLSRSDLIVTAGVGDLVASVASKEGSPGILIPPPSVGALRRLLDAVGDETEVRLTVGSKRAIFDMFPYRFGTTLSAIEFIGYERTIEFALGQVNQRMTVPRAEFLGCVRRVRTMAGDKNRAIALSITADGVRAETAERTSTDAVDIIEAATGLTSGVMEIGFHSGLLVSAMEALTASSLSCELGGPASPTFWRAAQEEDIGTAEHLVVVMPYRLSSKAEA